MYLLEAFLKCYFRKRGCFRAIRFIYLVYPRWIKIRSNVDVLSGFRLRAKVVEVDSSLVLMQYLNDLQKEWLYRGSTRLEPVYRFVVSVSMAKHPRELQDFFFIANVPFWVQHFLFSVVIVTYEVICGCVSERLCVWWLVLCMKSQGEKFHPISHLVFRCNTMNTMSLLFVVGTKTYLKSMGIKLHNLVNTISKEGKPG